MQKRILIAEDQQTTRELLIKNFENEGYEVVAVDNGIRLIAKASEKKFDLVITDLMMPDLCGVASTDVMKFKGDTTPIIALTGLSPQDVGLFKDKFARIFYKPINLSELSEYVRVLLGRRK